MWRIIRQFHKATSFFCLAAALVSPGVLGQSQSPTDSTRLADAPPDSMPRTTSGFVFTDIELSPEGVTAYDSSGNQWSYDFDRGQFVAGSDTRGAETGGREERSRDEAVEPVESRCIEEKIVDYPALKAVYVGWDEYVDGDIVAYNRVTVKGWVRGSVHSFNKTILVTSSGQVDGNVRAPEIVIRPGGIVYGEVIEIPPYTIPIDIIDNQLATEGIWVVFGFTLALTLIVFLVSSLAPRQMNNMTGCVLKYPAKSLLIGLLFVLLMPAIIVLVAITVVGLVVIWLVPIAYLVAFALGMAASGFQLTGPLVRRYAGMTLGSMGTSLAGVLMYMVVWTVVALLLGADTSGYSGYHGLGIFLLVVAIVGTTYPLLTGTGAAVLTRFGFRQYVSSRVRETTSAESAPAPAPPPIPKGPPPTRGRSIEPPTGPSASEKTGGGQAGQIEK